MTEKICSKMYCISYAESDHDIETFGFWLNGLKTKNLNISRMEHDFSMKSKVLKLCVKDYIFESYLCLPEATFHFNLFN